MCAFFAVVLWDVVSEHRTRTYHLRKALMLHRTWYSMDSFSTEYLVSLYVPYGAYKERRSRTPARHKCDVMYVFRNWIFGCGGGGAIRIECGCQNVHHWNELCVRRTTTRRERRKKKSIERNASRQINAEWVSFLRENCRKSKWTNDIRSISVASVPFRIKCHSLIIFI